MPRVPTSNGPQLQVQALNPVRQQNIDVSSGGRALGQGLGQLGEGLDRIALREDEAKANETDTLLTRAFNDWEDSNRGKFTNKEAKGYKAAVDAWWREAAGTYGKELSPRAQTMVGQTMMRRQTSALDAAGKYEVAETEKYYDSTALAAMDNATRTALRTMDYVGEGQRVRTLAAEMGARKNWDKDQRDKFVAGQLGTFHTSVVTQMAEKDANAAKVYLEDAIKKGEIGDNQLRLEGVIKGEADNQFAAQFAAQQASKPLTEQLAAAGEIADPERRKKALTEIKNTHAMVKEAQQVREKEFSDQAWQMVGQGRRVPEAILSAMDGKERVQLQEHLRASAERRATSGNKPVKTNPEALARVYDMMRDDPEGFKNLRMVTLTNAFSPSDIEQVSRVQRDMLKPDKEKDVITLNSAIDGYTGAMNKKDGALFKREAINVVDRFQIDNKRPPTPKERRQLLDDLAVEGVVEGMIWDTKKPRFEMTPEEKAKAKFPDTGEASAAPVRVQTKAQALALPKGTRFIDPNNIERIR